MEQKQEDQYSTQPAGTCKHDNDRRKGRRPGDLKKRRSLSARLL